MRAVAILAVALFLASLQPGAAQQAARGGIDGTRARDGVAAPKPPVSQTEKDAAAARSRTDARERAWDDKMKRTMRSICSGVSGC